MSSIKAFRFQLRLKPAQKRDLKRWAGALRWLWNRALREQVARHARSEKYAGYAQMCQWLTVWRNAPETAWLAQGPVHPQQQALRRLDEAYKRFFAKKGGFPTGKRWGQEPGLRFPDPKQFTLDASAGRLHLPKLGWVRLRLSRPVTGDLRNVTVTREGDRWYASIQVEQAGVAPAGLAPTLGIDLGLTSFAATSDGTLIAPLGALKVQLVRLRRYQRAVSRKVKGSCNRRKAVRRLGALHRRIARQRNDWLHQISMQLASEHPVIAIEDLRVANMSASAAGPGRKAKAGRNRGILDASWAEFRRQLEYKLTALGGEVIAVNPAYTSQQCHECGHIAAENRTSQSVFACVACGHTENADINAAKNILARGVAAHQQRALAAGHAASVHGEAARPAVRASALQAASVKWEPAEELVHA